MLRFDAQAKQFVNPTKIVLLISNFLVNKERSRSRSFRSDLMIRTCTIWRLRASPVALSSVFTSTQPLLSKRKEKRSAASQPSSKRSDSAPHAAVDVALSPSNPPNILHDLSLRPTTGILFTTNDLRIRDNYALALAHRSACERQQPLIAFIVLDERMFAQPSAIGGFYRQSPRRAQFTLECVAALRTELESHGVPLLIRVGRPELFVKDLCRQFGVRQLFMTTQYAPHEKAVHDRILKNPADHADGTSTDVHSVWQTTLLHVDDLLGPVSRMKEGIRWFLDEMGLTTIRATAPYNCADGRLRKSDVPRLSPFIQELLLPPKSDVTSGLASPPNEIRGTLPTLQELGYGDLPKFSATHVIATEEWHPGGEAAALQRMEDWLAKKDLSSLIHMAKRKRSTTQMYSHLLSRMSPYISTGCISVRTFNERLREHCYAHAGDGAVQKQYQEALVRLGRRDYWHFMGLMYGRSLFFSYGPRPEHTDDTPDWRRDEKIVRRWCAGLTGVPFADAAMRELTSTGWVAAEGRHALVWLLARGYGQDWRLAAEWLERCSLDYDPFVCYGNCAYSCGLIKDDFGDPVFDTMYTAHKHDGTGIYIRKWLPQLSRVPSVYIHRPHVLTKKMQDGLGVAIGGNYPFPIKLWDGATNPTDGVLSELPAYFATSEQLRSPGALEALTFGTKVLPEEERHLVAVRPPASRLLPNRKVMAAAPAGVAVLTLGGQA